MPKRGSMGVSEGTERKLRDFAALGGFHLTVSLPIMGRYEWASDVYHYVDLTAGPGEVEDYRGSPLLFLDNAAASGGEWRAWFCEKDRESFLALRRAMSRVDCHAAARTRLFPVDHRIAAAKIASDIDQSRRGRKAFGLIYADPNGTLLREEMQTARFLAARHPKMDVLLHVAANTFKRCRSVFGYPSLAERLQEIGKRRMLIREPHMDYQWTFVLLTDWAEYPEWRNRGFHDYRGAAGAAIFERLVFPERERAGKGQCVLW